MQDYLDNDSDEIEGKNNGDSISFSRNFENFINFDQEEEKSAKKAQVFH